MPRITVVVLALVCGLLVASSSSGAADRTVDRTASAERRITMDRPVAAGRGTVLLRGRVTTSARRVVLQRSADGRWVRVRRVPVRDHHYTTTVRARPKAQRFRVKAGRHAGPSRVVRPSAPTKRQDACGKRPRKPGGGRWSCTFVDDFDATRLNRSKWLPEKTLVVGHRGGAQACVRDHRDNIAVSAGTLRLTVQKLDDNLRCGDRRGTQAAYATGGVTTYHRFSQAYGRFEARFKSTATEERGLQEAFWLWPDVRQDIEIDWPRSGEIDIVETYSQYPELAIPFLHYGSAPSDGLTTARDCEVERGVFNRFTLLWSPRRIEILVNGKTCLVNEAAPRAFRRKFIVALTQLLGTGPNRYLGRAPLPATMTVDYVRVWR